MGPTSVEEPGRVGSVVVVLDHHGMMVTVDGACHNDGIRTMMPAAMVVERNATVAAVVQALAVLVDDLDVAVVSMVRPDNQPGMPKLRPVMPWKAPKRT